MDEDLALEQHVVEDAEAVLGADVLQQRDERRATETNKHNTTRQSQSNSMNKLSCTRNIYINSYIENTTRVPVGDNLSYNEWFPKRI